MSDREFYEQVEIALLAVAATMGHEGSPDNHIAPRCARCQLERLADEAADRAARA